MARAPTHWERHLYAASSVTESVVLTAARPVRDFFVNGARLLRRCTKPNRAEFVRIIKVVAAGVGVMGGLGVCIKLAAAQAFHRGY